MTEGRRLLVLWLGGRADGRSYRMLARRCGVSLGAIGALASGRHRYPSLPLAASLEREAGVAMLSWLTPAQAAHSFTPVNAAARTLSLVQSKSSTR
jgi:hypothetical protein